LATNEVKARVKLNLIFNRKKILHEVKTKWQNGWKNKFPLKWLGLLALGC